MQSNGFIGSRVLQVLSDRSEFDAGLKAMKLRTIKLNQLLLHYTVIDLQLFLYNHRKVYLCQGHGFQACQRWSTTKVLELIAVNSLQFTWQSKKEMFIGMTPTQRHWMLELPDWRVFGGPKLHILNLSLIPGSCMKSITVTLLLMLYVLYAFAIALDAKIVNRES